MSDEIRVGDRFEITVEVRSRADARPNQPYHCKISGRNIWLPIDMILSGRRLPRALKVGDRVTIKNPPFPPPPKGTVEWTDGIDALVRWFDGAAGLEVETLSDITPIGDEK